MRIKGSARGIYMSLLLGNTVTIVCVTYGVTKSSLHVFCRPRTILKLEQFMVLGTGKLKYH